MPSKPTAKEEWVTYSWARKHLRVSLPTLRRQVAEGIFPEDSCPEPTHAF